MIYRFKYTSFLFCRYVKAIHFLEIFIFFIHWRNVFVKLSWEVFSKFLIEIIVPHVPKRLTLYYIGELRRVLGVRESNWKQNGRSVKDGQKVQEIFKIFAQLNSRLMEFLMEWLLVLDLKECLVECATVCVKSAVILRII